eukprot:TRINITY_DN11224_c0_g1_i1.p2 TRINITY_DN11224_c0_g1~~TRINITY_DN11224_c0_g1_i1.p2  ORF type:complete len:245 (+),score=95.95 TRINITY_DN11224_c0_g1_i1:95-736(+)
MPGRSHAPSQDWHVGDKVFRAEHKEFRERVPSSLRGTEVQKKEFGPRDHMRLVPQKKKEGKTIDSWHTQQGGKIVEQPQKPQLAPREPMRAVEQPVKRELNLQHWNKALDRKPPPSDRTGWASDHQASHLPDHSAALSTSTKVVICASPHRTYGEKPPVEQPVKRELRLDHWEGKPLKTLENPQKEHRESAGWQSSASGAHSHHMSSVHKVVS